MLGTEGLGFNSVGTRLQPQQDRAGQGVTLLLLGALTHPALFSHQGDTNYLVSQGSISEGILLATLFQPHPACALPREALTEVLSVMLNPSHHWSPLLPSAFFPAG